MLADLIGQLVVDTFGTLFVLYILKLFTVVEWLKSFLSSAFGLGSLPLGARGSSLITDLSGYAFELTVYPSG